MTTLESRRIPRERSGLASSTYTARTMPNVLSSLDLAGTLLVVILFISNVPNALPAGASTITYWLVGGLLFFLPCVLMTAQLGALFPYEGGMYPWVSLVLGPAWGFFATFWAWLPAILLIVSTPAIIVSVLQGLNPSWLSEPWQQGLVIFCVVALSGLLALQRTRLVHILINAAALCLCVGILLIGAAGAIWLLTRHPSATSFGHLSDWVPNWNPQTGSFGVVGVVGLAFLGVDLPSRLLGEVKGANDDQQRQRHIISRHLLWGTILVMAGYLLTTWSLLVVQGQKASYTLFALISTVDMVLGKAMGNVVAVTLLLFLVMATVAYNSTYARLLLVAAVDRRIPTPLGRLNAERAPSGAIRGQTIIALVVTVLIYGLAPYMFSLGKTKPVDLATGVLNVTLASLSLTWAASTLFLFVSIVVLLLRPRHRDLLRPRQLVPRPVLWLSAASGVLVCPIVIYATLINSWIPTILGNGAWEAWVGCSTLVVLGIAFVASLFANSEAAWEFDVDQARSDAGSPADAPVSPPAAH